MRVRITGQGIAKALDVEDARRTPEDALIGGGAVDPVQDDLARDAVYGSGELRVEGQGASGTPQYALVADFIMMPSAACTSGSVSAGRSSSVWGSRPRRGQLESQQTGDHVGRDRILGQADPELVAQHVDREVRALPVAELRDAHADADQVDRRTLVQEAVARVVSPANATQPGDLRLLRRAVVRRIERKDQARGERGLQMARGPSTSSQRF